MQAVTRELMSKVTQAIPDVQRMKYRLRFPHRNAFFFKFLPADASRLRFPTLNMIGLPKEELTLTSKMSQELLLLANAMFLACKTIEKKITFSFILYFGIY